MQQAVLKTEEAGRDIHGLVPIMQESLIKYRYQINDSYDSNAQVQVSSKDTVRSSRHCCVCLKMGLDVLASLGLHLVPAAVLHYRCCCCRPVLPFHQDQAAAAQCSTAAGNTTTEGPASRHAPTHDR